MSSAEYGAQVHLPSCELKFGDVVCVKKDAKYAADFPEVFVVSGLSWHCGAGHCVSREKVNVCILPRTSLNEGGTDGFTEDDLRPATEQEIANNRRDDNT